MQIEKAMINDRLRVLWYPENFAFQLFIIFAVSYPKFAIFLQSSLLFNSFYCVFFL